MTKPPATPQPVYNLYVIQLNDTVRNTASFKAANPQANDGMACLYVGQTVLSPEERFANHLAGRKASRIVRKHGVCLRQDLLCGFKHAARRALAEDMETALAALLRTSGYAVWTN